MRVLADLVARLGLGEPHLSIAPAPVWRDSGGPADERVDRHLERLGWRLRDGDVDREVLAALAVVCRPDVGFHGWFSHEHRTTSVLAAAVGREGVLAVRIGETVTLRSVGRLRLAERLVAQVPEVRAGHGRALRVGRDELRATDESGRQRTDSGAGLRRARPEVRRAVRLISAPTTGAGELHVTSSGALQVTSGGAGVPHGTTSGADELHATAGGVGARHVAAGGVGPVSYVDTAVGRYLVVAEREVLEIRPATAADLVAELQVRRSAAATVGNSRTPHNPAS